MAITLRAVTGSALTHDQVDVNFSSVFYSASLTGQELTFHKTGSAAIGQTPTSTTFTIPSASKWTDVTGGGIARNSSVEITGSFTQGSNNVRASGANSHAQGSSTIASGSNSHAEGNGAKAIGTYSHAEGASTEAIGNYSHAEGDRSISSGPYSHAEGDQTTASQTGSHSEGSHTEATGVGSHAEGSYAIASGNYSHAEGSGATSLGTYSHAEGDATQAIGTGSHAEGFSTEASGDNSHAEGNNTIASGSRSHAEGLYTIALGAHQHVQGRYNQTSSADSAFIIGNGVNSGTRSNLVFASGSSFQVTGSVNVAGTVYATGDIVSLGNITAQQYIVSTSVYYVTESYNSGSHIFGNSLDDTHQFTGSLLVTSSIILKGTQTITGSLNILGTQTVNGAMTFTNPASTLATPDTVGNNSTNDLTIQGNQGLILSEANGNEGQIVIGTATNNVAIGNGTRNFVKFTRNWNAVTGSSNLTLNALHVSNSINLVSSSGTNIVRGLYINPTLTGVSDYRAIQVVTGSVVINGSTTVTGSLNVNDILVLQPRSTTPTPTEGMIIASGSAGASVLYYYNGTSWNALF